mmetsp:Transcript_956/g.2657  ORF Transcript_956/g.2657 Transcript_956/m.2657 type:complete len:253 (-) Transcript_956:2947-3705(-)
MPLVSWMRPLIEALPLCSCRALQDCHAAPSAPASCHPRPCWAHLRWTSRRRFEVPLHVVCLQTGPSSQQHTPAAQSLQRAPWYPQLLLAAPSSGTLCCGIDLQWQLLGQGAGEEHEASAMRPGALLAKLAALKTTQKPYLGPAAAAWLCEVARHSKQPDQQQCFGRCSHTSLAEAAAALGSTWERELAALDHLGQAVAHVLAAGTLNEPSSLHTTGLLVALPWLPAPLFFALPPPLASDARAFPLLPLSAWP